MKKGFFQNLMKGDLLSNNKIIFAILAIFLTMYGPKFAPKLPRSITDVFGSPWFRTCTMFLILYYSNKNIAASLLITIIFFVTSIILNKYFILEHFIRYRPGPPLRIQKVGPSKNVVYPLHDDKIKLPDEKVFQCKQKKLEQEMNIDY